MSIIVSALMCSCNYDCPELYHCGRFTMPNSMLNEGNKDIGASAFIDIA